MDFMRRKNFRERGIIVKIIKALIAQTPYRVVRDKGANRFQAIDASLRNMKDRGFSPRVVIDGGAHLGLFSTATQKFFPNAKFHLVEPQPACSAILMNVARKNGFVLHQCALSDEKGNVNITIASEPNTGVHVTESDSADTVAVPATTLDSLFAKSVDRNDRALLKMDLQGYELHALRGGTILLRSIEVILTEVSFFAQAYEPQILELVAYLDAKGFVLYDIAALAGRTRDNRLCQGDFIFARKGSQLLEDGGWE
jgi:FkbM family methyltransferase